MNESISNLLNDVAFALSNACIKDLNPIEYPEIEPKTKKHSGKIKSIRPDLYNISLLQVFQQTWPSTALGFDGLGCQRSTTSNVIIIGSVKGDYCVYFGKKLAYHIEKPNKLFLEDCKSQLMKNVKYANLYTREI